jgi:thiol-disulfide isomerase/thioredoxin
MYQMLLAGFTICCIPQFIMAGTLNNQEKIFLKKHWTGSTIPLQNKAPAHYSALERSLNPKDCGKCHIQQYKDWKTSLHSQAMGPGILGQLVEMVDNDPGTARICWSCHTPLAEQQDVIQNNSNDWTKNKAFDINLQKRGLVCAACHVRNQQRFGPPRKNSPQVSGKINATNLPHNGFTANTAFSKSAFCKSCHQFAPNDYALNGKLIENTYNEWKASDYAAKGIQCQDCHMPDRRHLWRGIHDPEMVKKGVTISVINVKKPLKVGEELKATIKIANTGTGHYFPTYLTPKIIVRGQLIGAKGKVLNDTLLEANIGREVTMDLSQELYDTRIAPGDSLDIVYSQALPAQNLSLKVEVVVYPDYFYKRFYQSILDNNSAGKGQRLIEEAYKIASNSSFKIFEKILPLDIAPGLVKINNLHPSLAAKAPQTNSSKPDKNRIIDWNDAEIRWLDYKEGLKLAKQTGRPIMLLFYADWCPTCHAYKHIFYNQSVAKAASDFIMIRVNSDKNPGLNQQYSLDGDYVPRTFALTSNAKLLNQLYKQNGNFRFFLPVENASRFTELMGLALKLNKGT